MTKLQPSLSYFLKRQGPYSTVGRNESEEQANAISIAQELWLEGFKKRRFIPTPLPGDPSSVQRISQWVRAFLRGLKIHSGKRTYEEGGGPDL